MDLAEAAENLARILDEECRRPTVGYRISVAKRGPPTADSSGVITNALGTSVSQWHIRYGREKHPREVCEQPQVFEFESTNFDLLVRLFGAVAGPKHDGLLSNLLRRVGSGGSVRQLAVASNSVKFLGFVSDMPLIAEFCIRTGRYRGLLEAAARAESPTYGLALMLMQFEEIVALNFNVFSEAALKEIPNLLAPIREMAVRQTHSASRTRGGGPQTTNQHYRPGMEAEARQVVRSIDGIKLECDQAVYFYVKGRLQQIRNPEVEGDRVQLVGFLERIGFAHQLRALLEEAERLYRIDSSGFELKSCLGHLRSFLETLHREAAMALAAGRGDSIEDSWGPALAYIRKRGLFERQHENFAAALYTLISDEGVHPLTAEREYARLLRTVVIEYGLMFLTALEKSGVKIDGSGSAGV